MAEQGVNDIKEIIAYWLGSQDTHLPNYWHNTRLWFRGGDSVDAEIKQKFEPILQRVVKGEEYTEWWKTEKGCLALALLLDQFPRNMYRGTPQMFDYDNLAQKVALHCISEGFDITMAHVERLFIYLVLVHSENLEMVQRGCELIQELEHTSPLPQRSRFESILRVAEQHRETIALHNRYPHRNQLLGRVSSLDEEEFLRTHRYPWMRSTSSKSKEPKVKQTPPATPKPKSKYTGKRVKILVLHSFRQNEHVLRRRCKNLKVALKPVAKLVYANAPIPYQPKDEKDAAMLVYGELPELEYQRVWWISTHDNAKYDGLDLSLRYIDTLFRSKGPFDGVLGFSQGGCLGGILAALQPMGNINFRFFINISGFPARTEAHKHLFQPNAFSMPSLHILGAKDILVDPPRTRQLAGCFAGGVVLEHPAGHFAPNSWPISNIYDFVVAQANATALPAILPGDVALPGKVLEGFVAKMDATVSSLKKNSDGTPVGMGPVVCAMVSQDMHRKMVPASAEHTVPHVKAVIAQAMDLTRLYPQSMDSLVEDLVVMVWCAAKEKCEDVVFHTILQLYPLAPSVVSNIIHHIPSYGNWKDLCTLAHLAHIYATDTTQNKEHTTSDDSANLWQSFHQEIVSTFGNQLKRDLECIDILATKGGVKVALKNVGNIPSDCAKGAPRIDNFVDKACKLARNIATFMHPVKDPNDKREKGLCYTQYSKQLTALCQAIHQTTSDFDDKQRQKMRSARMSTVPPKQVMEAPVSRAIIHPEPEPVVVAPLEDLEPLLNFLRSGDGVDDETMFKRGALLPDGKLDLCKQVVGPTGINPLLQSMACNPYVTTLMIGNNIVGNDGARSIAEYIKSGKSALRTWYIAGNNFDGEGIKPIAEALSQDSQVTALWLKRNPLLPAGVGHLANMLRLNCTLQVLDLVNTGVQDEGVRLLFAGLEHNKALKHLYLDQNAITPSGAGWIARHLAEHDELETLFLSCNRLGCNGAEILAQGLEKNKNLARLSLASNRIAYRGAGLLCKAVHHHPSLVFLDLGFTKATEAVREVANFIGDRGAEHVAEMLKVNTTLRSLNLLHNAIGQLGVNHIKDALVNNHTLTSLQMTQFGRVHNEIARELIREYVERNKVLVQDRLQEMNRVEWPDHVTHIMSVYRTK